MTRTITCRAHCSVCDRHFSSTAAFDRHRTGAFDPPQRRCLSPYDEGVSGSIRSAEGARCTIAPSRDDVVVVWSLERDVLAARKRWAA